MNCDNWCRRNSRNKFGGITPIDALFRMLPYLSSLGASFSLSRVRLIFESATENPPITSRQPRRNEPQPHKMLTFPLWGNFCESSSHRGVVSYDRTKEGTTRFDFESAILSNPNSPFATDVLMLVVGHGQLLSHFLRRAHVRILAPTTIVLVATLPR